MAEDCQRFVSSSLLIVEARCRCVYAPVRAEDRRRCDSLSPLIAEARRRCVCVRHGLSVVDAVTRCLCLSQKPGVAVSMLRHGVSYLQRIGECAKNVFQQ